MLMIKNNIISINTQKKQKFGIHNNQYLMDNYSKYKVFTNYKKSLTQI